MATDYGTDLSGFPDLDPSGALVTGQKALAQALARRLTTPRGGLFYDSNYGSDIRQFLNNSIAEADLPKIKAAVERECELDERVTAATATVTYDSASSTLKVSLSVTSGDGPFVFVLAITAVSATILSQG